MAGCVWADLLSEVPGPSVGSARWPTPCGSFRGWQRTGEAIESQPMGLRLRNAVSENCALGDPWQRDPQEPGAWQAEQVLHRLLLWPQLGEGNLQGGSRGLTLASQFHNFLAWSAGQGSSAP